MDNSIISDWKPEFANIFSNKPLLLQHRLDESGLFSKERLGKLIDRYPQERYNLNTMGFDVENPVWREGTIGDLSGQDVIEAIETGRMWLNLRQVEDVDPEFDHLLSKIFEEFEDYVPGFNTFRRKLGILISSPNVQVFYHADVPGQSLWQVHGQKRLYVYPTQEPYIQQENLEGIILGQQEEDMPYNPSFDDAAQVYDLEPGQMVHWPLNGPHRVENKDCMNVSVTTEHWTNTARKSFAVNYANGVLRRNFGLKNLSQDINSLSVYPKAALAMAWRKLNIDKKKQFVRMIDFKIDPASQTGMADIEAFAK